ncbi:MAG: hypothetical protein H7282_16655 [Cytophagaceae bacterium]|nr:hypothetical protein [Cytophagaceae bacterium]
MKRIIFCFLFLFVVINSNAQLLTTKKNGGEKQSTYFFASAGISFPQGYVTDDLSSRVKASAGPFLTLGYHYFFHKRWGMGLEASIGLYEGLAVERIVFSNQMVDYTTTPKGNWDREQLHLNFSYTPLIGKRWALDIIQGFSFYTLKRPAYDDFNLGTYNSNPAYREWELDYLIGVRGRILINDNFALLAGTSYSHNVWNGKKNYGIGFDAGNFELGIIFNLK